MGQHRRRREGPSGSGPQVCIRAGTKTSPSSAAHSLLLLHSVHIGRARNGQNTSQKISLSVLNLSAGSDDDFRRDQVTISGGRRGRVALVCSGMGCSSGHLPFPASDQEGALQAGGPKAPEALSTVERLAQATGGTEKSWYRCVFPFGLIALVIGVAGAAVTFTFDTLPQTKVVSVVLLGLGLAMVLLAAACWRIHRTKRRKRKEGGSFSSEQCAL
ncbi:hypothetical protein AAFF_G00356120 [Aldrovandia affinis]|uniref:Transmembrane protein 100 n=1 Tax=Aldrovandia affinis TaxID=143900 RepID=A0AAD7VZ84_9TELE|nr:hypothetical protein AAFF_G00356120 [Aldrovandia affinis]